MIQVLQENQIQSSYAARNGGIRAATGELSPLPTPTVAPNLIG
jgi:hypothetical protein